MTTPYVSPPPCIDQYGHRFRHVEHQPTKTICERCGVQRITRSNGTARYA